MTYTMIILSKRAKKVIEKAKEDGYIVVDVTSTSADATFQKFSPFYPHGNIPVPGLENTFSESVEGIWQGLKVFSDDAIDNKKFRIRTMKNLKRCASDARGRICGHQFGDKLLSYVEARQKIYYPSYQYALRHFLQKELQLLVGLLAENNRIVFLDYTTNAEIYNTAKPLSHASLIIRELESMLSILKP